MSEKIKLNDLYPKDNGEVVKADEKTMEIVMKLATLEREIKILEIQKEELKTYFQNILKESSTLCSQNGDILIEWTTQNRVCFDQKSFKDAYPELADKFTKQTSVRIFKCKI